jgi:hypothetical protein
MNIRGGGLLEGNNKNCNICHRHKWESEQQHRKGNMDTVDGIEEGIRTTKHEPKVYAKTILEQWSPTFLCQQAHLRVYERVAGTNQLT